MTNYNEKLDDIINKLSGKYSGSIASAMLAGGNPEETIFMMNKYGNEAKQAITSFIKELVGEARIDELERTMPHTDGMRHYNTVKRRIAELKAQQEEV